MEHDSRAPLLHSRIEPLSQAPRGLQAHCRLRLAQFQNGTELSDFLGKFLLSTAQTTTIAGCCTTFPQSSMRNRRQNPGLQDRASSPLFLLRTDQPHIEFTSVSSTSLNRKPKLPSKEKAPMKERVLGRDGARELTKAEVDRVSGSSTNCTFQQTHVGNTIDDLVDDCFN